LDRPYTLTEGRFSNCPYNRKCLFFTLNPNPYTLYPLFYDRRFLYKLRFDAPKEGERRLIWRSRMPSLPSGWYLRLAVYPLSGAQIENVARRALINGLMKKRPDLAGLEEMVVAESSFRKEELRITGFAPALLDRADKEKE
jgi:hypothetical protein